eukprot:420043-Rhodomonas_salina.1
MVAAYAHVMSGTALYARQHAVLSGRGTARGSAALFAAAYCWVSAYAYRPTSPTLHHARC